MRRLTKNIIKLGLVAAIYVVFTLAVQPLSFGVTQFRLGEILMVLPFINKKYTLGLVIGVFIANIASPYGIVDMIIGTAHTAIMCFAVSRLKNIYLVPPVCAVITGIMIGLMLYFLYEVPINLFIIMISVGFGELVMVILGVAIFKIIEKRYNYFYQMLEFN